MATYVQGVGNARATSGSISATFTATAGDVLIATVWYFTGGGAAQTTAVSGGGTWTKIQDSAAADGDYLVAVWACYNATGGSTTVTSATIASSAENGIFVADISGFPNGAAVDGSITTFRDGGGTSTGRQAGSITTTANGELVYCVGVNLPASGVGAQGGGALGGSFHDTTEALWIYDNWQIQGAAGPVNPGFTWGSAAVHDVLVAFAIKLPPPTVSSCSPLTGPVTGGGTKITITGTNFISGATVQFGANAATNVVVVNSTTITCTPPASTTGIGAVNVSVTCSTGTGTGTNVFTYAYIAFVSGGTANPAPGTTQTISYTPVVTGNLIVFAMNAGSAVTSVKDNNNNSLSLIAGPPGGGSTGLLVYAGYAVAGATSYIATHSGSTTDNLGIAEYAGSDVVFVNTGNTQVNAGAASITLTIKENGDFVVALLGATTLGALTTGLLRETIVSNSLILADNTAASAGTNVTVACSGAVTSPQAVGLELISIYTAPLGAGALCMGMVGSA